MNRDGFLDYIDIYCERLAPGILAEPLNALTNAGFFIAAFLVARLAAREKALDGRALILIGLMLLIGTGSSLFHTLALRWAGMADTLSILCYQIAFLLLYARYVMKFTRIGTVLTLAGFCAAIFIAALLPHVTHNVPVSYMPALLFVTGFGIWHWHNRKRDRGALLGAAALFTVSLSFRTLDPVLCAHWPLGTHFIWHILNAGVLYLTTRAYVRNTRSAC